MILYLMCYLRLLLLICPLPGAGKSHAGAGKGGEPRRFSYAALDKVLSDSAQRRALKLECAKRHAEDPAEFRTWAYHQIFDFQHQERFRERARDVFDISHELLAPEATESSTTVSEGSRQTLAALVELVKASQGVRVHTVDLPYLLRDLIYDQYLMEVPESLRKLARDHEICVLTMPRTKFCGLPQWRHVNLLSSLGSH